MTLLLILLFTLLGSICSVVVAALVFADGFGRDYPVLRAGGILPVAALPRTTL